MLSLQISPNGAARRTLPPMRSRKADRLAAALIVAIMAAASTTAASSQDYVPDAGMYSSEAEPEGETLELPQGLTLEAPILGYNSSDPEDCDSKYPDQAVGKGEQVRLCLIFNNQTNAPIRVDLPPGLMFVSRNRGKQNGMIAQRISFEVPAATRYFQPLFSYCINGGRDSAGAGDEYDLGKVTTLPRFQTLFDFLEDKVIDDVNFVAVHLAIGDLSGDGEIGEYTRGRLDEL